MFSIVKTNINFWNSIFYMPGPARCAIGFVPRGGPPMVDSTLIEHCIQQLSLINRTINFLFFITCQLQSPSPIQTYLPSSGWTQASCPPPQSWGGPSSAPPPFPESACTRWEGESHWEWPPVDAWAWGGSHPWESSSLQQWAWSEPGPPGQPLRALRREQGWRWEWSWSQRGYGGKTQVSLKGGLWSHSIESIINKSIGQHSYK